MNTTQQPEALRLANILRGIDARSRFANEKLSAASAALENQLARITELESQLAAGQATAAQQAGERVYAFRRKGLADFCTCDEARYEELSNKPHLFETRIFYTTPQPTQTQAGAVPLTDEQIQDLLLCGNPTDEEMRLIRIGWDAANGIKGGQHGTE